MLDDLDLGASSSGCWCGRTRPSRSGLRRRAPGVRRAVAPERLRPQATRSAARPGGEASVRRFSLCCGARAVRKRATPPSVRFLGRRVYLGAVVIVASMVALRSGRRGDPTADGSAVADDEAVAGLVAGPVPPHGGSSRSARGSSRRRRGVPVSIVGPLEGKLGRSGCGGCSRALAAHHGLGARRSTLFEGHRLSATPAEDGTSAGIAGEVGSLLQATT